VIVPFGMVPNAPTPPFPAGFDAKPQPFGVSFTGALPGIPLSFTIDGLGVNIPVAVGDGGLGIDPSGVQPAMPSGIGVDLSLPVLSGGGFLASTGPGGYGGVLDLDLIEITIQALGLFQLPVNGQPLSFVAIISVQFPFPGIQLGFGFALTGVGGVVAVNRRLDTPSLETAVTDGSVDQLLFPTDPASHGPAIVATLGQVFPAADGHVVVGPMLKIGWGGRILSLSVAVVIDLPSPVQLVIVGRLALALPDPDAPLILIQATVVVLDPSEVPNDALVIPTAMMGAPTVLVEKIPSGDEAVASLRKLEAYLGRKAFATMPIECGGINSTIPLVVGALTGLPVVDADGMGRAFPELQMETFSVLGVHGSPMVVTNEYGDSALIEARDDKFMEWLSRGVTIRMGGAAYIAEYSMSGAEVKRTAVPNTISLGIRIGRCLRVAKKNHKNPIDALLRMLPDTLYSYGRVIWRGKVIDVKRETKMGWALGLAKIEGAEEWKGLMEIQIQNENLIARVDGKVRAIVPDLICVMEAETAEPITTEYLRYGQRVVVVSVAVPSIMRTPEALEVFGPKGFRIDEPYTPIEQLG